MIAQAHNFNTQENVMEGENENMKFRKMFELSHDDIRSKLYQALDPTLPEDTWSWICDVYDDRFVVGLESAVYKTYQYTYTKDENNVVIDFDSKVEVTEKSEWVKIEQTLTTQLNEAVGKLTDLENEFNLAKESIDTLQGEKDTYETQLNELTTKLDLVTEEKTQISSSFNEATGKLTQLQNEVEDLKPFKEQLNEIKFTNSLNEKKEFYKSKFNAFSAKEKFDSDEVQELIKTYALDNEDSQSAQIKLNSLLVDLVEVKNVNTSNSFETTYIREMASKTENLIPNETDFDSKYA
ncbi:hypothetical protein [Paenibacillus odorifer]|uniref:hypothetical protein n=1 Tax=Paenibacillus odorifer TaxID=189426 RepID=UPI0021162E78|nr:hypothetical protein [Paenibacillus odorifer]